MATARSVRGLGIYLIVVGIVLATFTVNGVTSEGCDDAVSGLKEKCSDYVMKLKPKAAPSKACCDVIKSADLACVCKQMTPGVELLLDVEKVVIVAKTCGKPLTSGTKCGSATIP